MNTFTEHGSTFFQWILQTSWQAVVLVGLILLVQWLFGKRLSPAWRHGLWLLLVIRLLMPTSPQSAFSVFNVAHLPSSLPEVTPRPPVLVTPSAEPLGERETVGSVPAAGSASVTAGDPGVVPAANEPAGPSAYQLPRDLPGASPASDGVQTGLASEARVDWLAVLFGLWLAGVAVLGFRLVWSHLRFRSRMPAYAPVCDERTRRVLDDARAALGLRRKPALLETDCVATPAVYGLWRKRLLLPAGMMNRFSDAELRHIFLHELAHLKRRDLEVNWLVAWLQILHWFNPVLWFAFRRMRADRELAADALALSCVHETETAPYGETILKVLEGLVRQPLMPGLVGVVEEKTQIARRMRAIAQYGTRKPWKWIALVSVIGIATLALTDADEPEQGEAGDRSKDGATAEANTDAVASDNAKNRTRFELRVVDYDSGRPIEGATVGFEIEHYGGPPREREAVTGKDGTAAIDFETPDLARFSYRLEEPGYLAPEGEWLKHQTAWIPAQSEIKASQGIEIGGRVIDEKGRPVAGAAIYFDRPYNWILRSLDYSQKLVVKAGERVGTTDATGRWSSQCLYPDVGGAALRIRHPEFADTVYSTRITEAMEAEGKGKALEFEALLQQRAAFTLEPGRHVTGRVVDDSGNPLPGVPVRYADRPSENPHWDAPMGKGMVTTDAEGIFRIAHLPEKRVFFSVQTGGYAPAVQELDLTTSTPEIEINLKRGQQLRGQVIDHQGRPVSGARLSFKDWSIWQGIRWLAVSDEEGRFEWNFAPEERFAIRVEKEGFITRDAIMKGGAEEAVSLKPVLNLFGKVIDAESKEPIERFRIFWGDQDDRLDQLRRFSFEGSNGVYSVDVGRIESDLWVGGYAHEFLLHIEAEGYAPRTSRVFSSREGDVGGVQYDFALEPSDFITGRVVDTGGQPVAGAQVALKTPLSRLRLADGPRLTRPDSAEFHLTDREGRFRLTADPEATHLIAVHERGIAWVDAQDIDTEPTLKLQLWGRVEGTVWEYDERLANQEIWHSSTLLQGDSPSFHQLLRLRGKTDDQGRFSFDFVPPGRHRFYRMIPMAGGSSSGPAEIVHVTAGETAQVRIGGVGRPVTGRFKITNPYTKIDWQKGRHSVHGVYPSQPDHVKTQEENKEWRQREDVQRAFDSIQRHPIQFSEDGSFRIEEMLPGEYRFSIQIHDPRDPNAFSHSRYIANYGETFTVPDTEQHDNREPLDIGVFELSLKPEFEAGKTAAPDFTAQDLEGGEFSLADFHGKYVLLDFWATWCGPCIAELPYLREAHRKFGGREDFVMIGLSLDDEIGEPREFVNEHDLPWLQGYLGKRSKGDIPGKYGVEGIPAVFLINPEGKLIAKDLRGGSLLSELAKWLGQ